MSIDKYNICDDKSSYMNQIRSDALIRTYVNHCNVMNVLEQ